jgi:cytochrome c biogenesis protein CcdA
MWSELNHVIRIKSWKIQWPKHIAFSAEHATSGVGSLPCFLGTFHSIITAYALMTGMKSDD